MKKRPDKKKWLVPLVIFLVFLACVIGYAAYYFNAFTKLQVSSFAVDQITEFSLQGFAFTGHLDIYNPNRISVKISRIEYGVVFEPTSQLLTKGVLMGQKLPPNQVTRINLSQSISWAPALSLILQLVTNKEPANIVFSGYVHVTEKIRLPFVHKVDVRAYFEKFVEQKKEQVVEQAVETVEDRYGQIAGEIAKRIAGYFT